MLQIYYVLDACMHLEMKAKFKVLNFSPDITSYLVPKQYYDELDV